MKTRVAATAGLALVLLSIGVLISCSKSKAPEAAQSTSQTTQTSTPEQPPKRNPDRNAYFGEEHIHTSWSMDAWLMGNRITDPDDALQYAQGKTIKHPMGYDITIDTPMDFMGVTATPNMSVSQPRRTLRDRPSARCPRHNLSS